MYPELTTWVVPATTLASAWSWMPGQMYRLYLVTRKIQVVHWLPGVIWHSRREGLLESITARCEY